MKNIIKLCLLTLSLASFSSYACNVKKTNETTEESMKKASVAFVGTVEKVTAKEVVFMVHLDMKGDKQSFTLYKDSSSSCDIKFTEGQAWLYLGNKVYDGSVLLASHNKK